MNKKMFEEKVRMIVLSKLDVYRDKPRICYDENTPEYRYCVHDPDGISEYYVESDIALDPEIIVYQKEEHGFHLVVVLVEGSFQDQFYVSEDGQLFNILFDDPYTTGEISEADLFYVEDSSINKLDSTSHNVYMRFSIDESEFRDYERSKKCGNF